MQKLWLACLTVLIGFLLSCGNDDITVTDFDVTITAWLDTMNVDSATRDDSGIYYYTTVENPTGIQVTPESVVSFYYTLSDLDGNVLASHQASDGDSLVFKSGVSALFPIGLDAGIAFMNEGETFHIIVPPSQGYRELTSGAINRSLITLFEVEVVRVQNEQSVNVLEQLDIANYITSENLDDTVANPLNSTETFASGVVYKRVEKGFGALAVNGENIILSYQASYLSNTVFDQNGYFQFVFGSDQPRLLIPGFEFGLSIMEPNERALFIIPSSQAYRESALVVPAAIAGDLADDGIIPDYAVNVPPYTPLVFDITRFN